MGDNEEVNHLASDANEFVPPNAARKCTYGTGNVTSQSPHEHRVEIPSRPRILPDVLSYIGETPLIRINKIGQSYGLKCELLAKCEFFSASSSVKDRIALRMVEDAERHGLLQPGGTIVEATAGNTGIALAMVAAVKGYRMIAAMPEIFSDEKADVMRGLGAEIIRTPYAVKCDDPTSCFGVAHKIRTETPNSFRVNQHGNRGNPLAHYDTTAEEILEACDGKVDMLVAGAATGGTMTGIGRKLKEKCPDCKVIGVDPYGSIMARPGPLNDSNIKSWLTEGFGHDFLPTTFDQTIADKWYKFNDKEAFLMARRLINEEGLLVGGSSGAAMHCAVQAALDAGMKEGDKVVVVMPDSIRNYLTGFLSDDWMKERDFIECAAPRTEWWWSDDVKDLDLKPPHTVDITASVQDVLDLMTSEHLGQVIVLDNAGSVQGVATVDTLMSEIQTNAVIAADSVTLALSKKYKQVTMKTTLGKVAVMLNSAPFVVVNGDAGRDMKAKAVVTRLDLLHYVTKKPRGKQQ